MAARSVNVTYTPFLIERGKVRSQEDEDNDRVNGKATLVRHEEEDADRT